MEVAFFIEDVITENVINGPWYFDPSVRVPPTKRLERLERLEPVNS